MSFFRVDTAIKRFSYTVFDFEEDDTKPELFYSVYKHCRPVKKKKQNIGDDAQASEVKIVQITFSSVLMEF